MSTIIREKRCLICDSVIQVGRMHRHPSAVLCGVTACFTEHHRRRQNRSQQKSKYVCEYVPPAPGEADHADPHFRAKVRPCGRCGQTFRQSVRWRYFCERCRESTLIKTPPTDRTYAFSSGRRSGGG